MKRCGNCGRIMLFNIVRWKWYCFNVECPKMN